MRDGWKTYNKALLPNTAPHEVPNLEVLRNKEVLRNRLFARYATDFDCGYETEWWYLIKDDRVDINKLKSNRRYKITKGLKNSYVKKISPKDYDEQIYEVYIDAFNNYKKADKPQERDRFIKLCREHENDSSIEYYGVFEKVTGELVGYSLNNIYDEYVNLTTLKFKPKYLSKNIAAALIHEMLIEYLHVREKRYVNDGERSIRHDTNFQEYLIKYFGFRKAYCKLNVVYNPFVKLVVNILYPFRKFINKISSNAFINNINSILEMEKIRRSFY